jgi:hypothetical protein
LGEAEPAPPAQAVTDTAFADLLGEAFAEAVPGADWLADVESTEMPEPETGVDWLSTIGQAEPLVETPSGEMESMPDWLAGAEAFAEEPSAEEEEIPAWISGHAEHEGVDRFAAVLEEREPEHTGDWLSSVVDADALAVESTPIPVESSLKEEDTLPSSATLFIEQPALPTELDELADLEAVAAEMERRDAALLERQAEQEAAISLEAEALQAPPVPPTMPDHLPEWLRDEELQEVSDLVAEQVVLPDTGALFEGAKTAGPVSTTPRRWNKPVRLDAGLKYRFDREPPWLRMYKEGATLAPESQGDNDQPAMDWFK